MANYHLLPLSLKGFDFLEKTRFIVAGKGNSQNQGFWAIPTRSAYNNRETRFWTLTTKKQ
jgi:hypothetical protein